MLEKLCAFVCRRLAPAVRWGLRWAAAVPLVARLINLINRPRRMVVVEVGECYRFRFNRWRQIQPFDQAVWVIGPEGGTVAIVGMRGDMWCDDGNPYHPTAIQIYAEGVDGEAADSPVVAVAVLSLRAARDSYWNRWDQPGRQETLAPNPGCTALLELGNGLRMEVGVVNATIDNKSVFQELVVDVCVTAEG